MDDNFKKELLKILDIFVDFCNEHSLCYSLSAGTLLGAIRHKGFIPWDDDIDVCMPRKDYNVYLRKFNHWLVKKGYKQYKMMSLKNPKYYYLFTKIINKDIKIVEDNRTEQLGAWIDVMPVDYVKKEDSIECYSSYFTWIEKVIEKGRIIPYRPINKTVKAKRRIYNFFRNFFIFLDIHLLNIIRKYHYVYKMYRYRKTHLGDDNMCFYFEHICRMWYKMDDLKIGESVFVSFEGKEYKAMKNWDNYLSVHYGDYMKLPKESERVTHKRKILKY